MEGEHEFEVEVGVGDRCQAQTGFGGVLKMGADVGEIDEGHAVGGRRREQYCGQSFGDLLVADASSG